MESIYIILAGPRFGFARNDFKFVLICACVALIRSVTTRNNNYFTFVIRPIWHVRLICNIIRLVLANEPN